jgi:hypothetical protein
LSVSNVNGKQQVGFSIFPDLQVTDQSGDTIGATVISVPTQSDPDPLGHDFAILKLGEKPNSSSTEITLSDNNESVGIGDEVVFSGYPLGVPALLTHRGMVSGWTNDKSVIFIEAAINKGNSGGAVLNSKKHAIGILCNRVGGISVGLDQLREYIGASASHGSVAIMGVDTLQATKALIDTLDTYISTGMGSANAISFVREYLDRHDELQK